MRNTSWGGSADWYNELLQSEKDTYQRRVILPNLLRRMDIRRGERVLDVACGQGFFTREFHAAGARVTGVDISSELIMLARQHSSKEIVCHTGSADALGFLKDGSFDKVAVVLALQNMENVHGVLAECARVLSPKGKIYTVMNHPAFRVPKESSWGWDPSRAESDPPSPRLLWAGKRQGERGNVAGVQYRRIDQYLSESKEKIQMHPGDKPSEYTLTFHRPLQFYFKSFAKAGFAVMGLEEWISHKKSEVGPRARAEDRARKEIPLFLLIESIKLSQVMGHKSLVVSK